AVRETLPLSLSPFSAQMSVGNKDTWDGLSGSLLHLAPDSPLLKVAPMAPLVGPAVAAPVPLPTIPQAETATTGDARGTMALAQEDTALPEYDATPASRHMPESQERVAEARPSVGALAIDSGLPLVSARATSHTPSAEPAIAVPLSHSLEDLGRQ